MDQEEIKKSLRHSFTSAQPDEEVKISKNQFGHTVLGDVKPHDVSLHTFEQDESGSLKASFDIRDLADHPELQKFHKVVNLEPIPETEPERVIVPVTHDISKLISELDEMEDSSERKYKPGPEGWITVDRNTQVGLKNEHFKSCFNKNCLYNLPKDANFCMKCGTAQMPKFCTECGFSFLAMEKFCPDCGTKR